MSSPCSARASTLVLPLSPPTPTPIPLIREDGWMGWEPVPVIERGTIPSSHTATYQPFGGVHTSTGALPTARFPGQWFQSESGLHQNWMRDYDPTTGRYLQADPLGLVDGASVYGYVKQNPMRFTDPTGQFVPAVIACLENPVCVNAVIATGYLIYDLLCAETNEDYINALIKFALSVGNPCKGVMKMICAAPFRGGKGGGSGGGHPNGSGPPGPVESPTPAPPIDDIPIVVTPDGVAIPADPKYSIPDNYVQNPYRSGSYGEYVNGKFVERLRIDPPTPTGKPGPEYSHYHVDGEKGHLSPRPGDSDLGFSP